MGEGGTKTERVSGLMKDQWRLCQPGTSSLSVSDKPTSVLLTNFCVVKSLRFGACLLWQLTVLILTNTPTSQEAWEKMWLGRDWAQGQDRHR